MNVPTFLKEKMTLLFQTNFEEQKIKNTTNYQLGICYTPPTKTTL
jgi:hypothetical protein